MSKIDHRSDGMMSVLNRVSTERARFGDTGPTSLYTPDTIYATDGIAAVIIDRPAEDAVAGGFTIEGDENNDILNEFDRLDAWPVPEISGRLSTGIPSVPMSSLSHSSRR